MINLYSSLDKVMAEMVFSPQEELVHYLKVLKMNVREDEHILYVDNPQTGFHCGFSTTQDPVTKAAMLALLILGINWAELLPDYLKIVNKRWEQLTLNNRKNQKKS